MTISQYYGPDKFGLSFELYPPKTEKGETALYQHVESLMEFNPNYITCTYGAGGSTQHKTLEIVTAVKERFNTTVASHLTCVGSSQDQLRAYLTEAGERGIDAIVALRGDPPQGETEFKPAPDGFSYANELVSMIHQEFPNFGIAVAGYPDTHKEATSPEDDLANLKQKVDCGGEVIMTQLFYINDEFFAFREKCNQLGIQAPIIPGILPVTSLPQIQRISTLCGTKLPQAFVDKLGERDDPDWQMKVGIEFATQQTQGLIDAGVPGVHFYVLNKSQATGAVLKGITLPQGS